MRARFVFFSVAAAAGISFSASHLIANVPKQPIEAINLFDENVPSNDVALEQDAEPTAFPSVCEGPMQGQANGAAAELIEQADIDKGGIQAVGADSGDADDETVRIVEPVAPEGYEVGDEAATDELLELSVPASEEIVNSTADATVPVIEEAAGNAESTEVESSEFAADAELIEDIYWEDDYSPWFENIEVETDALPEEVTRVEEIVELPNAAEVAEIVEAMDGAVHPAINDPPASEVGTVVAVDAATPAVGEVAEEIGTDKASDIAAEDVDQSSDLTDRPDVTMEEAIESLIELLTHETQRAAVHVDEALEPVEPTVEGEALDPPESTNVDESLEVVDPSSEEVGRDENANSDEAADVRAVGEFAVEEPSTAAPDDVEEFSDPANVIDTTTEEASGAIQVEVVVPDEADFDAHEFENLDGSDTRDGDSPAGVVERDESQEIVTPTPEEADLQPAEGDMAIVDTSDTSQTGTTRTMELPGWKVTVESEQPMDDLQLLNMLRAAIYQLEAELD